MTHDARGAGVETNCVECPIGGGALIGILTVRDVREGFGIDLDFADVALLTLSACETAVGGIASDGSELESFASVAQQEGARSVMATLWPVEDASIASFMEGFYARQVKGDMRLAESLAATQRAFLSGDPSAGGLTLRSAVALTGTTKLLSNTPVSGLEGYRHPFHWAPVLLLEGAL